MSSILRIANLCKTYNITETIKEEVLKGVNLELNEGEMVAIVGESGCGKSTLLNILGGLDTEYTGSIVIKGNFIRDYTEHEMDDYRKKRIGMVFQSYNLISHMTIKENIMLAMQMSDVDKETQIKRAEDLLTLVGLFEYKDKYPNQLSGGQCQRASIARALANNPSIILADEPTGALDKDSTNDVINILKKISEMGKLVVIVTHSSSVAESCSRVIRMEDGVIASDELKEKPKKNKYEKYKEIKPKSINKKSLFRMAFDNTLSNKGRNILVSIGISIGIAALIIILAISSGITSYVNQYFGQDEANEILTLTTDSTISKSNIDSIKEIDGVSNVLSSYRLKSATYVVTTDEDEESHTITYTYSTSVKNVPDVLYGRIPATDSIGEVMVDLNMAMAMAGDSESILECINKTIDITYSSSTYTMTIVGVFDDSDTSISTAYFSEEALNLFYSKAYTSYNAESKYSYNICYVKVSNITYLESVSSKIKEISSSITVSQASNNSSTILDYIELATKVLTGISMLALAVASIMIIIVQYVSIVERTKEIGILRSIGARRGDISNLFMYESMILGIFGGALAFFASYVIAGITNLICYLATGLIFISFNPIWYLIGLAVSILVSILAGIAPARKASNLDPIECLRSE